MAPCNGKQKKSRGRSRDDLPAGTKLRQMRSCDAVFVRIGCVPLRFVLNGLAVPTLVGTEVTNVKACQ
jgi:hypothetical protein